MTRVRVLLVDDHTVVRRGLRKILCATAEIDVVGEVGDGHTAVSAAAALQPDVVLMDVGLPGLNGIEATRQIKTALPNIEVLMLSMHSDQQYVQQSFAAGAKGYLLKDTDDQDLVAALLAVHHGETYLSRALHNSASGVGACPIEVLSAREREILGMIGLGRTNREVADALGLSPNTVETHRKHIIDKLDLHSTAELVRYALRHGLVS